MDECFKKRKVFLTPMMNYANEFYLLIAFS